MANVDRIQVFIVAGLFNEDLVVQIVEVFGHEDMDIPHYFQHI